MKSTKARSLAATAFLLAALGSAAIMRSQQGVTDRQETENSAVHVQSLLSAELPEDELIEEAGFIGRGEIVNVGHTRWNAKDGEHWEPTPVWATVEALGGITVTVNPIPIQYHEVTIRITDEWYDSLSLPSEFNFAVWGPGPDIVNLMDATAGDSEVARSMSRAESYTAGEDVVVMLDRAPVLFRDGTEQQLVSSESSGAKYVVQPDGSLTNLSPDRSSTLSELHSRVLAAKATPTPER